MNAPNRNALWAAAFVDELARAGVREVCIAPGSRSTPLVMAAARHPDLSLSVHLDERSAAFFALGIGKGGGRPAAVLTTSGTAAANLFPAVVEACQSETPLLLLTADRPLRLLGADANQAIDQNRLYGTYVRAFVQIAEPEVGDAPLRHLRVQASRSVASALGAPAGPVHVNLPFDKPLEPVDVPGDIPPEFPERHPVAAGGRPSGAPFTRLARRRAGVAEEDREALLAAVASSRRGLIVAGPDPEPVRTGPAACALAAATGFPLLADPLSGARFGPSGGACRVPGYDLVLRSPEVRRRLRPDLIVRLGASPTSAAVVELVTESLEARQIVIDPGDRWRDHEATATDYLRSDPAGLLAAVAGRLEGASADHDWRHDWERAGRAVRKVLEAELGGELFEGAVVAEVARRTPPGTALFVSSSMPVRDLDAFALPRDEHVPVFGNRGASGIDGIVSTACGVAAVGGEAVVAILGDLAFYHDMNGLLAARRPDLQVVFVLVNNDGGGIFHMLPIRDYEPEFTPYFATPHGLDFAHAAALYGLRHRVVGGVGELGTSLEAALETGESGILEIRTDRELNRRRHREVAAAVTRVTLGELE